MKKIITFILCVVICLCFVACASQESKEPEKTDETTAAEITEKETAPSEPEEEIELPEMSVEGNYTPLLYKITDEDGSSVWLFGSVHYGVEKMIPMPDYVMEAYNTSDALAVECDILSEDSEAASAAYLSLFVYTDGTSVSDHISKELYESAKALMEKEGLYNYSLESMVPYMWEELLTVNYYEKVGLSEDYGIDRNFLTMAKESGKEIQEVESSEFQLQMMADFSPELQKLMLDEMVETYYSTETFEEFKAMINAWYNGDAEAIAASNEADYDGMTQKEIELFEDYNKTMLYDRNIGMADFAVNALDENENVFICVGAAHVVGEGGIIDLLEEEYSIEIIR